MKVPAASHIAMGRVKNTSGSPSDLIMEVTKFSSIMVPSTTPKIAILGVVLGTMMEENFVTSMIKSDGDPLVFFTRPIAMWLAAGTFIILLWPVGTWLLDRLRGKPAAGV